jgi:hypothetical protein
VRSSCRIPLASSTIAAFGTPNSSTIERSVLIKPWCIKCRAPPLGQRATWRSRASGAFVDRPHCGHDGERRASGMSPRDGAPQIRRIVVRAKGREALRPRGVLDIKIETLPWLEWDMSLGLDEGGASARKERKDRQSRSRRNPSITKRTPFGAM